MRDELSVSDATRSLDGSPVMYISSIPIANKTDCHWMSLHNRQANSRDLYPSLTHLSRPAG